MNFKIRDRKPGMKMKKHSVYCAIALFAWAIAAQCAGSLEPHAAMSQVPSEQENVQLNWSNALPARVAGKIEECAQYRLCIISNATSRSRVSHYVYGSLREELSRHKGRFAIVFGKELSDAKNPWKKHLLVEKIYRIGDEPAGGFVR
jgi:hypothetical protein